MATFQDQFKDRIKSSNDAQCRIEEYWKKKGTKFTPLGLDQRNAINNFYLLPKSIKSLPDYIVEGRNGNPILVEVKGTVRLKLVSLTEALRIESECDTSGIQMYFLFIVNDELYLMKPSQVFHDLNTKTIEVFPDNLEPYIKVNLHQKFLYDEIQSSSVV